MDNSEKVIAKDIVVDGDKEGPVSIDPCFDPQQNLAESEAACVVTKVEFEIEVKDPRNDDG